MTTHKKIILASGSPRRRELLQLICPNFEVCLSETEETLRAGAEIENEIIRFACEKAANVAAKTQGEYCVIGADTMVVCDGETMGKPKDRQDAARMLRALSGQTHEVFTAVALQASDGYMDRALTRTAVRFYPLTEREIEEYIATGEPMDKAGAYGIQGAGAVLVEQIEGDFYSVMGLPVAKLRRMLRAGGFN